MHALERGRKRRSVNIWPGFVDALATLLLVVIFVLMVFMIAQFFLSVALSGKDEALDRLNSELSELADLLALERDANAELRINVAQLSSELQSSLAERDSISGQLAALSEAHESLQARTREITAARESLAAQISGLMAERSDLENLLQSSLEARESLAAQLAALANERDRLAESLEAAESAEADLTRQLAALVNEKTAAEASLSAAQAALDAANRAADADKGKIELQLAEILALKELKDQMTRDLDTARSDAAQARKDLEEQLGSVEADREKIELQLAEIVALKKLRDQLTRDLTAAQSDAAQARKDLEELLGSVEADKEKVELQLAEIVALKKLRDQLTRDLAAAQSDAAQARKDLEEQFKSIEVDREKIEATLAELAALKRLRDDLTKRLAAAEDRAKAAGSELEDAYKTIKVDKEKIEIQLFELSVLKEIRAELDEQLKQMEAALAAAEKASEEDKAGRAGAEARVAEQVKLTEEAQLKVDLLNRQMASLRRQLAKISVILEATEVHNKTQKVQIADLGKRLNLALATKVQELARYRSEFFGRLREVLGNRRDIRIVGDRFVFQSELLFESGSAELGSGGREQIAQLAVTLKALAAQIPPEINWILRVDGHTDDRPISTFAFASNWELSTARALSVVKFLVERGIDASRLAATGFGEFQPLDNGDSEVALRRNRRIELKFTQK